MSVSLPNEQLLEIQELAHSSLQRKPVTVNQVMSFWARPFLVPMVMHNSASCVGSFRVICCIFTILWVIYSFFSLFSSSMAPASDFCIAA